MRRVTIEIVFFLLLVTACPARIIIVDPNGTGDYPTIQAAINDANNGDTIIVADGTYIGPGNRDIDFNGLAITVKSENGPKTCIIDCNATLGELHRAFTFNFGEGPNSIVKGFTITNGYALNGGAIYCDGSSPTVSHCIIAYNNADANGGGIYCHTGSPTMSNCVISVNSADANEGGGGIYCDAASPTIINCTVTGNSTNGSAGGGISCVNGSNPMIRNSIFWADSPNEISLQGGSSVSINYCDVQGGAAGVGNIDTDPLLLGLFISHWRFDEGEGTTAYDSFGSNHGTIYGAQWTTGQIDGALSFDGVNDYVDIGDDASLNITGEITVAAWAKFSASQNNEPLISKWGSDQAYILAVSHIGADNITFTIKVSNVNKAATSANTYNDGEWHHYVGVFNGSNVLLYVDGGNTETVIGDATTGSIDSPGGNPLRLGNYNTLETNGFNGTIDEAMIFNRALSAGEVQQLYQGQLSPGQLFPEGLYPDSPCIDAGDPNYVQEPDETDLDGKPRVVGDVIDMGADEFRGPIYVDNDAPEDPGPNNPDISDSNENGSLAHPFDAIQEAIDVASNGETVVVLDGTYTGDGNRDIDFLGKAITVRSENGPSNCIIDCNGTKAEPHRGFYFGSCENEDSILDGFTLTNGYSTGYAGGIYCWRACTKPTIRNCIITENTGHSGAGITCNFSSPTITNCIITNNYAYYDSGGGILCWQGSSPVITGCTISNNEAKYKGGGIFCNLGNPTITNCTIVNNKVIEGYGGGIHCMHSRPIVSISNCILWGNMGANGEMRQSDQITRGSNGEPVVNYCCIQGLTGSLGGIGNISDDPCFVEVGYWDANGVWIEGDYHLRENSPCIDTGDPNHWPLLGEKDIDGEPRVMGGRVDMGVDEFTAVLIPIIGVSSAEFEFTADESGPNPPAQVLLIRNIGADILNWGIAEDCNWLEVEPNVGTSIGDINEVTLSVDVSGLAWGQYTCDIMISDPCAINNPQMITVNLDLQGPAIELSAIEFDFFADTGGPNPPEQILTIRNSGAVALNWTISEHCNWLEVDPNSGSSTGEANEVTLSVDVSGLDWGQYTCDLTISDPCAMNNPQTVDVNLTVHGPEIGLSATYFSFDADEGGANPADQILTISNNGGGTLNWTISEDCSWLDVDPNTGSSTEPSDINEVFLSVDITGLLSGDYNCVLTVSDSNAENDPQLVNVNLTVHGPIIALSSTDFDFFATDRNLYPAGQILTIRNSGADTLNWTISYDCNWLDVYPTSGSSTGEPNDVILSVDITGLAKGPYYCNLTISDPCAENSPQDVNVGLFYSSFPPDHEDYQNWLDAGEPECWCSQIQCYGDVDGLSETTKQGTWWVSYEDLNILSDGWQRPDSQDGVIYPWTTWRCADFDHVEEVTKSGRWRVSYEDLNILTWNWQNDNHTNPPDPDWGPVNREDCLSRGY